MTILMISAAFVGFVHSLAPSHWLPVVLMGKMRKWPLELMLLGALVTASGHIVLSILLGLFSIWVGSHFLSDYEEVIEQYMGLALGLFGLIYAGLAFFRHSGCHGHIHHGPSPRRNKAPFLFLFSLGLSPCVAALPVFAAAAAAGSVAVAMTLISFAVGVLFSLLSATVLVSRGIINLDHPIFEHYGDVITGLGVTLMGIILFFAP